MEIYRHDLLGHTIIEHNGRRMTFHRDMPVNDELLAYAKKIMEWDPVAYAAKRRERIAEFERVTGTKFE